MSPTTNQRVKSDYISELYDPEHLASARLSGRANATITAAIRKSAGAFEPERWAPMKAISRRWRVRRGVA